MTTSKSEHAFERAKQFIPGGVNSPVRSFNSVGGTPRFMTRGAGSRVFDIDGTEYIDYVGSWGPLILGHADPRVVEAIQNAARKGTSFGAPTENETILAQMICEAIPSVEMIRLVSSGTEAVMSAIRLARGFTGKNKIIKAAGCYHGHVDQLLVQAGSGLATLGLPGSAGIPKDIAELTIIVPYNDLSAVQLAFETYSSDIAAILVEPIAGNMGVVHPADGYLTGLRKNCDKHSALLIFDEVITGFRVGYGGAQNHYGVNPDITTFGKIIGGGLPIGAYGGKKEIMQTLAPLGPVYQAGTLSGNPISVAAGIATLQALQSHDVYEKLENLSAKLELGLLTLARRYNIPLTINRVGSMMTPFFTSHHVACYDDVKKSNTDLYNRFFHLMLERGIYLPPSAFEAMFVSSAHSESDIDKTLDEAAISFELLPSGSYTVRA